MSRKILINPGSSFSFPTNPIIYWLTTGWLADYGELYGLRFGLVNKWRRRGQQIGRTEMLESCAENADCDFGFGWQVSKIAVPFYGRSIKRLINFRFRFHDLAISG